MKYKELYHNKLMAGSPLRMDSYYSYCIVLLVLCSSPACGHTALQRRIQNMLHSCVTGTDMTEKDEKGAAVDTGHSLSIRHVLRSTT